MKEETKKWLLLAEEHFSNMQFLLENSKYSLSLYCAHQALEMILKALIVELVNKVPSKSHNLDFLLRDSQLQPESEQWFEDLAEITRQRKFIHGYTTN